MVMVCCGAKTEVFGGSDSGGGFGGVDRFARVAGGLRISKDASDSSTTIRSARFFPCRRSASPVVSSRLEIVELSLAPCLIAQHLIQ